MNLEPTAALPAGKRRALAAIYAERLEQAYGDPRPALHYRNPFELLLAVILSAQTTDEAVNRATPELFAAYPMPEALANAEQADVESLVHSLGFFRQKARNIIATARMITTHFDGRVPDTMEELIQLPGVARKTANIVLGAAFGKVVGIAVDTHVFRLAHRLGLSAGKTPDKVERDLMDVLEPEKWYRVNYDLISHGRAVCTAKKPACDICFLSDVCPSAFQFTAKVRRSG